ncbi:MAG: HPr family phosphocarrier protein [Lentisphaeria bacterium]|nr:HPr family phosphocarrier protein [Lentisphaeria bacterium]
MEAIRNLEICNKLGLHGRPAMLFVKLASGFSSEISVCKDDEEVDGKSLLGLMMLAAGCGSKIKIIARGEDSQQAVAELSELVKNKFNEE